MMGRVNVENNDIRVQCMNDDVKWGRGYSVTRLSTLH